MPGPPDFLSQIKARGDVGSGSADGADSEDGRPTTSRLPPRKNPLAAMLEARAAAAAAAAAATSSSEGVGAEKGQFSDRTNGSGIGPEAAGVKVKPAAAAVKDDSDIPPGTPYRFDESSETFRFSFDDGSTLVRTEVGDCVRGRVDGQEEGCRSAAAVVVIPLAPCAYRLTDYTYAKREPISLRRCSLKLNVLRCLARERDNLNVLLRGRCGPETAAFGGAEAGALEEEELGKVRFMELLSNCGVYQKVSEQILRAVGRAEHALSEGRVGAEFKVPCVDVRGLDDFLTEIENRLPALAAARKEIDDTQTVSFFPGLGELFKPGAKLLCYPDGMEGSPLGCSVVQAWYDEELNQATNKTKRRFVLVVEFIVSVGDELVFVAASDVYPEFHDTSRNVPLRDLTHRRLWPERNPGDSEILSRLRRRGEFYATVAVNNHYLEYHPHSFFPIIGGGWSSNAVRPLPKGGRVMVDVKRGILEGHIPVRATSDGMSDTVKEAIKLFEQSKRTGVAVPFRTCLLDNPHNRVVVAGKPKRVGEASEVAVVRSATGRGDSDRPHLWQAWPMVTGFSFTARVWGKLLLGLPKPTAPAPPSDRRMMQRSPSVRRGVCAAGLGGAGASGNCGYIAFQERAFDQLVLDEDKKELIRAVARNAGGGTSWNDVGVDFEDDEDTVDMGIDVVANKGGASIFLLSGPPGTGKTLTAEAIAELLRKPLYIVTAGDLGITAAEVEKSLGSVLELCQTWDALVLVDEADVFLEARNSAEIQRNALVCVMLRLLEYYSGCLFLSSNRDAGSIDAAIASRITVMLSYPPLDSTGRAKVWRNLVELVPPIPIDGGTGTASERIVRNPQRASRYREMFSDADYAALAEGYQLNGRQIKNSIVLARALARERGAPLSMSVLRRAVTAVAGERAVAQIAQEY